MNAIPIPAITAVSVIKLAPLLRLPRNTVVPIRMQLSTTHSCHITKHSNHETVSLLHKIEQNMTVMYESVSTGQHTSFLVKN